jgi:hypothetical protein
MVLGCEFNSGVRLKLDGNTDHLMAEKNENYKYSQKGQVTSKIYIFFSFLEAAGAVAKICLSLK